MNMNIIIHKIWDVMKIQPVITDPINSILKLPKWHNKTCWHPFWIYKHIYSFLAYPLFIQTLIIVYFSTFYLKFIPSKWIKQHWNQRNACLAPACMYLAVDMSFCKSTCSCSNCAWMIYKRFKEKCKYQHKIPFLVLHTCYKNDKCTQYGKNYMTMLFPFTP